MYTELQEKLFEIGVEDMYEITEMTKFVPKMEVVNAIEDLIFYGDHESKKYILVREDKLSKGVKSGEQVLQELGFKFKELYLGIYTILAIAK